MLNYILRRLLSAIPVLIGISIVSFMIIQLPPGDFASSFKINLLNNGMAEADAQRVANEYRKLYGLDQPLHIQYLTWIRGIVTEGNFGYSFAYKKDVGELIAERLPRTLALALAAHLLSTLIGISIGIYAATHQYSLGDIGLTILAFIGTAIPRFFLALLILYWLAFTIGAQHFTSFNSPQYALAPWSWPKVVDTLSHVWPVIVIAGFGGIAQNMRVMRGNLLDVLNAQYVTTARSKGLLERKVINRHAVRQRAASDHYVPGHGAAIYAPGRAGGGDRAGAADPGADVLPVAAQPGYLCVGRLPGDLRHPAGRRQPDR